MFIEPGTRIRLLRGVPLDTTYEHTIWFNNKEAQAAYFMGKTKYNVDDSTYQRVGRGVARVGYKSDDLYDCNYMMFQNTNFGSKWFYAYITSVEYINNVTSEIRFEIDIMQTWLFDHTPDWCVVEREHSETDNIGEHIEPESVAMGEYVFMEYEPIMDFSDLNVIIEIVDTENATADGNIYDGIYGGATLYTFWSTHVEAINQKISDYIKKPDAILGMYLVPRKLVGEGEGPLRSGTKALSYVDVKPPVTTDDTLNGYKPKNNKMYTYPYNYYHIDNASGSSLSLRYEFFRELKPAISIGGTLTQPVQMLLNTIGYKNSGTDLLTETLQINGFPMCSWNMDSYKAWSAQNATPTAIKAGTTVLSSIIPMLAQVTSLASGAASAGVGILGAVGGMLSEAYTASIAADICKGNANNGNINCALRQNQFYGGRVCIAAQDARRIDDFFTKFGYAVGKLKIPNRSSRPHWNYVKTIGATLTGSVPADDMKALCSIYDNGITFWKNGDEIGNYGLDNSPT